MSLRPRQQKAVDDLTAAYRQGFRAPVLVAATGFGKTHASATIIRRAMAKGKRVWFIADEILEESKTEGSTIKFSRKLVMAECLARGIAFYTARTQFQQWYSVNRDRIAA